MSAHGTLVAHQPSGQGGFTTIGELHDIKPPDLTKKSVETTAQNDSDDYYVTGGVRRRGEMTFEIGYTPSGAAAAHTALRTSFQNNTKDIWKVTYPDGAIWQFSGWVVGIAPNAPLEDALVASVTIRPTGPMTFA